MKSADDTLGQLDTATLERGAARMGLRLSVAQLEEFRRYYRWLVRWNARMNLTTVTEWEAVQTRHFLDSLSLVDAVPAATLESIRFVDIATGAGLPGIPLKIVFADARGTLVDATAKKVEALKNLVHDLGLDGIKAIHGRAETLGHSDGLRESFDLVTARAVAPMPVLAELTLPFCRVGGMVVVHKTEGAVEEIASAEYAIEMMGGEIARTVPATWEGPDSGRKLIVIEKLNPTPANYPRRPGMPSKRPLMRRS